MKTKKSNSKVAAQVVVASIEKKAAPLMRKVGNNIVVETQKDYERVAVAVKALKALRRAAEDEQRLITVPLMQAISATKNLFKPFMDRVDSIEEAAKEALLTFQSKQDDRRAQLEKELETGKIKKVATFSRKVEELEITGSAAKTRMVTGLRCVDAKKTPREYLVPDERAILDALKQGEKVAGWELEVKRSIAI